MSLHRRMVSPSTQPPSTGPSDAASLPSSSVTSQNSTGFRGLGFPGVVDTIWSTSVVGPRSSWLPTSSPPAPALGSFDIGKGLLSPPDNDCELVDRQDSW